MNAIRKRILARHLRDAMGEIDALKAKLQTAVDALMAVDQCGEQHTQGIAQEALEQIRDTATPRMGKA